MYISSYIHTRTHTHVLCVGGYVQHRRAQNTLTDHTFRDHFEAIDVLRGKAHETHQANQAL